MNAYLYYNFFAHRPSETAMSSHSRLLLVMAEAVDVAAAAGLRAATSESQPAGADDVRVDDDVERGRLYPFPTQTRRRRRKNRGTSRGSSERLRFFLEFFP